MPCNNGVWFSRLCTTKGHYLIQFLYEWPYQYRGNKYFFKANSSWKARYRPTCGISKTSKLPDTQCLLPDWCCMWQYVYGLKTWREGWSHSLYGTSKFTVYMHSICIMVASLLWKFLKQCLPAWNIYKTKAYCYRKLYFSANKIDPLQA